MNSLFLYIFLLALWYVVLFVGHSWGINVILFLLPLVLFLYKVLKDNKKIKNWYGFLFGIPIILLSLNYLLFNNNTFNALNFMFILLLLFLMYYYSSNNKYKISAFFKESAKLLYRPFNYIGSFYKETKEQIRPRIKPRENRKSIWKTLLIVVPIVLIVLALLAKADQTFANIFSVLLDYIAKILRFEFIDKLLGRIFLFIVMFFVLGITTKYLINEIGNTKYEFDSKKFKDIFTLKVLIIVLNVIYIIFDIIQIKVIFSNNELINYSYFARKGFFELMVVSFINLSLILLSKKFEVSKKDDKFMKVMNILMIGLTLIIIVASFMRMHIYELAYGYTTLRIFVDVILISEALLMIPTVMYIINDNFDISKSYLIIIICVYTFVSFLNIDGIIACKNINRYKNGKDLDIQYLETYTTDNVVPLIDLYNSTDDAIIKYELETYFKRVYEHNQIESWEEFNYSKHKAIKLIEENGLN